MHSALSHSLFDVTWLQKHEIHVKPNSIFKNKAATSTTPVNEKDMLLSSLLPSRFLEIDMTGSILREIIGSKELELRDYVYYLCFILLLT